jgi:hypothetical protein
MKQTKFTRDDSNNRIWTGKEATYRVLDQHGVWLVELHPRDGVAADDIRDDSGDAMLLTLAECKVFIDNCEQVGDAVAAYDLTLVWRNRVKG